MRRCPTRLAVGSASVLSILLLAAVAKGQVVLEGASDPVASGPGCTYCIEESFGARSGANLFHGFELFDVGGGESAIFFTGTDVANVVARVVGGSASEIAGTVGVRLDSDRASPSDANLFVLNSSGILFSGEGIHLDLGGAFYATSAEALVFEGGGVFPATGGVPAALPDASPAMLRFSGDPAGDILFDSALIDGGAADPVELTVVGANILDMTPDGGPRNRVSLPGRSLQLAAVGSAPVDVPLDLAGWDLADAPPADLGEIDLSIRADLSSFFVEDRSRVVIRGGRLALTDSSIVAAGVSAADRAIDIEVTGDARLDGGPSFTRTLEASVARRAEGPGEIRVAAGRLEVVDSARIRSLGGGAIAIEAGALVLETGGRIASESDGGQPGGAIVVEADSIELSGAGSEIGATTRSAADGGSLSIAAGRLAVDGAALGTLTEGAGRAGNVRVEADSIQLSNGGQITGTTDSAAGGRGGDVTVVAHSSLSIEGRRAEADPETGAPIVSGIFARSGLNDLSQATGEGGRLTVQAGSLVLRAGGSVQAQSLGPEGAAGAIAIDVAGDLTLDDGLISTSARLAGSTNDLRIAAGGDIRLLGGSRIRSVAPTFADGATAGSVELSAGGSIRVHNSALSTDSARADSGNVTLEADGLVDVFRSQITTNIDVTDGSGGQGSGDVTLRGTAVVVDKSAVTANAAGLDADAGDISIVAPRGYFQSGDSLVQARSEFGVDGAVLVLGPAVDLAPGLSVLAAEFHDPADELRDVCDARTARVGSFTVRDRVPSLPSPDDPMLRSAPSHREASGSCELR